MSDEMDIVTGGHIPIRKCECECHTGVKIMHFMACCQGMCIGCETYFVTGLEEHQGQCTLYHLKRKLNSKNKRNETNKS